MQTNHTEQRLFTTREAAKYLAISEKSIYNHTKSGLIQDVRFGRTVRYDIRELEAFIERCK